ncbi:MAG: hypothetical protein COV70_04410 [Parcubacteria group bacterium CG11_big_fil_rev_8_21_14_0_20_39_22]|nr:MAG: hypothetical protein COV70_04410 [Parcubacteria group bacterium CG11_big_fil_rev_8_21_14_0_20_39_22]
METILQTWEQINFMASIETRLSNQTSNNIGSVKNWRGFRKLLLSHEEKLDPEKFFFPSTIFHNYFLTMLWYDMVPNMFYGWSRTSRRLYSISEEMQMRLEMTSIGNIRWEDITPPVPFFTIQLPIPIPDRKGFTADTLLVNFKRDSLYIIAVGMTMNEFKPLPKDLRAKLGRLLSNGKYNKLLDLLKKLRENQYCFVPGGNSLQIITKDWSKKVMIDNIDDPNAEFETMNDDGVRTTIPEDMEFWFPVLRIVVGLILHINLAQRPGEKKISISKINRDWTIDPTAVTNEADVVSIQYTQPLTEEERRIHGIIRKKGPREGLKELRSHYRDGHWRRPPGKGDDPDYPQTVEVSWTVVNKKRLPKEGLPSGVQKQV